MEGEWSCYRNGHKWRENGHVTKTASLTGGACSCYIGGQFNGERMVILRR